MKAPRDQSAAAANQNGDRRNGRINESAHEMKSHLGSARTETSAVQRGRDGRTGGRRRFAEEISPNAAAKRESAGVGRRARDSARHTLTHTESLRRTTAVFVFSETALLCRKIYD